jgi:protein phosphatase 1G
MTCRALSISPYATAYPEISENTIGEGDEFLVIACDGIWDVMTSQQCVDYGKDRWIVLATSSNAC